MSDPRIISVTMPAPAPEPSDDAIAAAHEAMEGVER